MLLLIDAYNLLHQSDVLGRSRGERWLERARRRLVRKLIDHLDATLAAQTCLVFDANSPPPDRPSRYLVGSMQLIYAVEYPEADDLLELLIARHPTPRRLTVISSDHRIQRAASRRGATPFDADRWYARLTERGPQLAIPWPPRGAGEAAPLEWEPEKPPEPTSPAELVGWYEMFGLHPPELPAESQPESQPGSQPGSLAGLRPAPRPAPETAPPPQPAAGTPAAPKRHEQPKKRRQQRSESSRAKRKRIARRDPHRPLDPNRENPFPDGYGEDLL